MPHYFAEVKKRGATSSLHSFFLAVRIRGQRSSNWGTRTIGSKRKHVTPIKTKHRNRLHLGPDVTLALAKIRPRTEALACHKQAQSSH
jgi:hypothetical protein